MIELAFAVGVAAVAAAYDLRTRMLPDWLTLGALPLGFLVHVASAAASGARGQDLLLTAGSSVLGGITCAAFPALLVQKRALGRGDLKLFAALGVMLGPAVGFEAEVYAFVAAAIAAPLVAWRAGRLGAALRASWRLVSVTFAKNAKVGALGETPEPTWMPFAPAILFGVVLAALGADR